MVHPPPPPSLPSLKARLARGEYLQSATVSVPSPEIAAQLGAMGFDFLWIEMEHAPITLETLRTMILATRGLPVVPIARVPVTELWTAKRVLDAGALGVVFPFVNSAALAARAADACRYPPRGLRGSGAGFAQARWPASDYYEFADREVLGVAVVERAEALDEIDAIAATPGIDVLFIGVSDLSFSLGLRGQLDAPELDAAIAHIATAARRHGKYLGRPALDSAAVARFHAEGFQFFQGPTDVNLLREGARQLLAPAGRFRAEVAAVPAFY